MTDASRADEVQRAPSLCAVFQDTVRERPEDVMLRSSEGQTSITWRQAGERVRRLAAGFAALGVGPGSTVGIMLTNRPEFALVDLAVMHLGATPFSIYNTSSPGQIEHLFTTAGNRVVVCEQQFVDRIRDAGQRCGVERIVCVDGDVAPVAGTLSLDGLAAAGDAAFDVEAFDFDAAWRSVGRDDLVTLIFTSGTTGLPKAVEITHANQLYAVATILRTPGALGGMLRGGLVLSYLPDAHMANRLFAYYVPLATGATMVTVQDGRTVGAVLREARPTTFVGVPMIWYRLRAGVEQAVANAAGERQALMRQALETGLAKVRLESSDAPVPADLAARYAEADRLVLAPLRAAIGLDRVVAGISGGAPITADVLRYLMALGIPVLEGWAMSETAGAGTLNPPDRVKPGTVGLPVRGTEIRVADDGELLLRSPGVMRGYRNDPAATAAAVDPDGWLHTGDVVTQDEDGYVTIVDRKKELIINSAGKNMSPAGIENAVKQACPLAGSIVAIGDRRPYVVALLTLDPEAAAGFAARHGLDATSPADLARDPQVQAAVRAGIEQANATLSRVEQIKAYTILPTYWLPNGEELTPTLKVRRKVVAEKYAAEIEEVYARPDPRRPVALT